MGVFEKPVITSQVYLILQSYLQIPIPDSLGKITTTTISSARQHRRLFAKLPTITQPESRPIIASLTPSFPKKTRTASTCSTAFTISGGGAAWVLALPPFLAARSASSAYNKVFPTSNQIFLSPTSRKKNNTS